MLPLRPDSRIRPVFQHCRAFVLVLPCALMFVVAPARAWGPDGHRIVGELAEQALTPATRAQVQALLEDETEPTLAGVANWADTIRSEDAWRFTGPWHYLNVPDLGCNYQPPRDCPNGNCVIGAIEAQTKILEDLSQPLQKRIEALKFVVHFVGDVHQPLHAGLRSDRGGNDFQISYRSEGWNLHSVWDSLILRTPLADASGWLGLSGHIAGIDNATSTSPSDGSPSDWAMESCGSIDAQQLYPATHKIDDTYLIAHLPLAEARLREAGTRLATLLNAALPGTAEH